MSVNDPTLELFTPPGRPWGIADLHAVAVTLGEQDFLSGAQPGTLDCSAFAFVEGIADLPPG